jgi:hypothetical protein
VIDEGMSLSKRSPLQGEHAAVLGQGLESPSVKLCSAWATVTANISEPGDVARESNNPTSIGGRDYRGHTLDRVLRRDFPPPVSEDAIQNGTRSPANTPVKTVHTGSNGVTVVTVIPG